MASYNIIVSPKASDSIRSFYRNVSKKYCHTYSYELMTKNITDAIKLKTDCKEEHRLSIDGKEKVI